MTVRSLDCAVLRAVILTRVVLAGLRRSQPRGGTSTRLDGAIPGCVLRWYRAGSTGAPQGPSAAPVSPEADEHELSPRLAAAVLL